VTVYHPLFGDPIRPPDTDEEPWTPADPPGFSMTGGDVFLLAAAIVASWGAVIVGVLLVRRVWSVPGDNERSADQ
jgi:hypothetical protein